MKLLRTNLLSAVSNYRDINAGREFDRHFLETSRTLARLSCQEWSFPVYSRVSHLRACICTWYIMCHACMHVSCTYVEDACSRVARACVSLISPRTTSAYKLPNFLRELVQKVEKGKQCRRQDERTERGGTCTIQYPTNLVSRTGRISLIIQTNEIVRCTWYFASTLLATNEIKAELSLDRNKQIRNHWKLHLRPSWTIFNIHLHKRILNIVENHRNLSNKCHFVIRDMKQNVLRTKINFWLRM